MPRVSSLFFKTAILFLIAGIAIGLKMSISGVHNVTGAHAHCNLLGWVTMALMGTYYTLAPSKAEGRLPVIQYGVYTLGVLIMIPSLYMLLLGNPQYEPGVAAGSLITFAGVFLFAFVIFSKERVTAAAKA
ncbi:MAG: hypothetical protein KAH44_07330 [Oricola sp.]|nr:hypothetical protein [Ahrensia sp.]MCK5746010.1 hypothetical protein [Oricola sp.]|tara:strand:- start:29525 stop:29917 length:393 start_codon:yes stop_codon:yes gene_type:complete